MANSVIDTFVPPLRRTKTFASIDKHHPSQPREPLRIRKITFLDGSTTPDADAVAAAAPSVPDETKSGPKGVDSKANQKWRESLEKRIIKLARFGPTYGDDTEAISKAKDLAWGHITTEEDGGERCYLQAIKDIEKTVVECYDDTIKTKIKRGIEFRRKMARDGCFFLQLSLHILGGGEHLGYPETNPYFGENIDSAIRIPDMFFVGNQIPYIVIKALMEQPFFQGVIQKGVDKKTWKRPQVEDLAKLALYLTVVEPHLENEKQEEKKKNLENEKQEEKKKKKNLENEKQEEKKKKKNLENEKQEEKKKKNLENEKQEEKKKKNLENENQEEKKKKNNLENEKQEEPSSNVLQILHSLMLRSGSNINNPNYHEMKEFQDLEANNEGKDKKIPSAGELRKLKIKLVKGEAGIPSARFENWGYSAFLYVPPFTIDAHTVELLTSLANHELALRESERELTAYIRFMRDLSPTYNDFRILEKEGIIIVKDNKIKGTTLPMLDAIVSRHNSNFTLNFCQIRRQIKEYGGPPWRLISYGLGVLTVIQTIFTVLSYCIPPP